LSLGFLVAGLGLITVAVSSNLRKLASNRVEKAS